VEEPSLIKLHVVSLWTTKVSTKFLYLHASEMHEIDPRSFRSVAD